MTTKSNKSENLFVNSVPTKSANTISTNTRSGNSKSSNNNAQSESEAGRNVTLMLISMSSLYICGTTPYMFAFVSRYLNWSFETTNILFTISSPILFLFPGMKIFVFIFFFLKYRQQIKQFFQLC